MPRKNARPADRKRRAKIKAGVTAPKRNKPRRMPQTEFIIMAEMAAASAILSGLLRKVDDEATRP